MDKIQIVHNFLILLKNFIFLNLNVILFTNILSNNCINFYLRIKKCNINVTLEREKDLIKFNKILLNKCEENLKTKIN